MNVLVHLMNRSVIRIDCLATVEEASKTMDQFKIGSLLVMKNNQEVGLICEGDLVRRVLAKGINPCRTPVEAVMSAPLITISFDSTGEEANEIMKENGIRHLLVHQNGKIIGIFSVRDLMKYFKIYYDGLGTLKQGPSPAKMEISRHGSG
jgi:signal-transduction protein with cAMP-binding, CBS, and nucleotidyltransferase domain